jgi:hypothetical protein
LVTDALAELFTQLVRHARGGHSRREPARLEHHDLAALRKARIEQRSRQARGLAGTGLGDEHEVAARAQLLDGGGHERIDRQGLHRKARQRSTRLMQPRGPYALALLTLGTSLVLGLSACASDDEDDSAACEPPQIRAAHTPLPPEIDAILEQRCRSCHSNPTQMYAPFPLVSWEDLHMPYALDEEQSIYEIVARRIDDPQFPMPPARQPQLDDCAPPAADAGTSD